MDMSDSVPASNLDRALCPNSLAPTLGLQRREYWEEINPLLAKWKSVNDTRCPECARMIRVNMARHLRLEHSDYVCFWRCLVTSCSLWLIRNWWCFRPLLCTLLRLNWDKQTPLDYGAAYGSFGTKRQGPHREHSPVPWGPRYLILRMPPDIRSGVVRQPEDLRRTEFSERSPEYAPLRRFFNAAVVSAYVCSY